jgi:hypothetical protein
MFFVLAWYQYLLCSGFEEGVKNVKIQFRTLFKLQRSTKGPLEVTSQSHEETFMRPLCTLVWHVIKI